MHIRRADVPRFPYNSYAQERNVAAWIRNASRSARKIAQSDLGGLLAREQYIFPAHERKQRLDDVCAAQYDAVKQLKTQYENEPLAMELDRLLRGYDEWKLYRRRQK